MSSNLLINLQAVLYLIRFVGRAGENGSDRLVPESVLLSGVIVSVQIAGLILRLLQGLGLPCPVIEIRSLGCPLFQRTLNDLVGSLLRTGAS